MLVIRSIAISCCHCFMRDSGYGQIQICSIEMPCSARYLPSIVASSVCIFWSSTTPTFKSPTRSLPGSSPSSMPISGDLMSAHQMQITRLPLPSLDASSSNTLTRSKWEPTTLKRTLANTSLRTRLSLSSSLPPSNVVPPPLSRTDRSGDCCERNLTATSTKLFVVNTFYRRSENIQPAINAMPRSKPDWLQVRSHASTILLPTTLTSAALPRM